MAYVASRTSDRKLARPVRFDYASSIPTGLVAYALFVLAFGFTAAFVFGLVP